MYYGGNEFSGGTPFTGFYYELYPNGKLELYSKYQDGLPIEDYFEFYEDGKYQLTGEGKVKTAEEMVAFYTELCHSFDKKGNLTLSSIWKDGKFIQEHFEENEL